MKELLKKLQYHSSFSPVLSVNTPIHLLPMLEHMEAEIHAHQKADDYAYILLFIEDEIAFDRELEKYSVLAKKDGMFILCYSKKIAEDTFEPKLNEKFLWTALQPLGFTALSTCDIDNNWQAIAYKKVRV